MTTTLTPDRCPTADTHAPGRRCPKCGWTREPDVRVGDVWADNDRRQDGRTLKVVHVEDGKARLQVVTNRNAWRPGDPWNQDRVGKYVTVSVARMRPTSTGYRLIERGGAQVQT